MEKKTQDPRDPVPGVSDNLNQLRVLAVIFKESFRKISEDDKAYLKKLGYNGTLRRLLDYSLYNFIGSSMGKECTYKKKPKNADGSEKV